MKNGDTTPKQEGNEMSIKNSDLPAMPITEAPIVVGCDAAWPDRAMTGLSKREMFAMTAMQGMLANGTGYEGDAELLAKYATSNADALLAELEKSK